MASSAASSESGTTTPLPAASPSALTTGGWSWRRAYSRAASASRNVALAAVATPARAIISLAKAFDVSSRAAARLGPKTGTEAATSASATPAANGPSGPMTTRS